MCGCVCSCSGKQVSCKSSLHVPPRPSPTLSAGVQPHVSCVSVCAHVHKCTHTHTLIHTDGLLGISKHTRLHTQTHILTALCQCTPIAHTFAFTHTHTHTHTYTHIYTHIHTHSHSHPHRPSPLPASCLPCWPCCNWCAPSSSVWPLCYPPCGRMPLWLANSRCV